MAASYPTTHDVPAHHQPQDRQSPRPDDPAVAAGAGGRGDPSMRTVGGSRGYLAVDLLFRIEVRRKAIAQWPQDRRSAERPYPDTRPRGLSGPGRARDLDVPGGTRPPAIHSRTRRITSCSISTTTARRGGAAQSVSGHDRPCITPSTPALEQVPWEDRVSLPPLYAAAGAVRPRRRNSS
jgi:hypothetical protein